MSGSLRARLARLERELADRPPDPSTLIAAIERFTIRTRTKFVTGAEPKETAEETWQRIEDEQVIQRWERSRGGTLGLDGEAERAKAKMLQFGARGSAV